jgi:hypothetical protein
VNQGAKHSKVRPSRVVAFFRLRLSWCGQQWLLQQQLMMICLGY